jgi:hypothetical protein
VRKHRKTAKKVMRGGGVIWSQMFSVVDKSPEKELIKRNNVFKISVSDVLGARLREKKFGIQLEFDLDQYPDEKDFLVDYDYKSYNITSYSESPSLIIVGLIQHICGNKKCSNLFYEIKEKLGFPNKKRANKAHEQNKFKESDIGRMSISKKMMDTFITKDGKVKRPCTINMSLRINNGKMCLFLDDYTKIIKTTLYEFEIGARLIDAVKVFGDNPERGKTHDVYEWRQINVDRKMADLDTIFTKDTLVEKLNELEDETDKEYIFYQLIHNIKKENTRVADIDKGAIGELKYENTLIKFNNGDTFNGTFEIISTDYPIRLIDGTYTWADGTVYKGTYDKRRTTFESFKNEGTYRWPDGTSYEGYFKVNYRQYNIHHYDMTQDKLWTFEFNSGLLTKVDAAQVTPPLDLPPPAPEQVAVTPPPPS